MKLPEDIGFTYWLFADNLKPAPHNVFEFSEAKIVKSKKGTDIPVFVLLGQDTQRDGEFQLSMWNIDNFEDLKKQYGDDTSTWGPLKFKATAVGKKIKLEK